MSRFLILSAHEPQPGARRRTPGRSCYFFLVVFFTRSVSVSRGLLFASSRGRNLPVTELRTRVPPPFLGIGRSPLLGLGVVVRLGGGLPRGQPPPHPWVPALWWRG